MFPRPAHVRPTGQYRLALRFEDGTEAELDFARMVQSGCILCALREPSLFEAVEIDPEAQTLVWPNGADVCPDVLYHLATGVPLPGALDDPPARLIGITKQTPGMAT